MAERFHIGEWYGYPFLDLSDAERLEFADHKVGGAAMKKSEIERLTVLEAKSSEGAMTERESARLGKLRDLLDAQNINEKICPFRTDSRYPTCTKPGGVCSLQLVSDETGVIQNVGGERGRLRALCPYRFHQGNAAFSAIGERLLDDPQPLQIGEVGFLESTGNLDSDPGEDVGRIDMILVKSNGEDGHPMQWAAVEVQAVYFSGKEMKREFKHLKSIHGQIALPQDTRRPDYRSSGPKRLMPQLQTKVPTLRRWGRKMAIIVDVPFFESMGKMRTVPHISNADIIWFLVDFVEKPGQAVKQIEVVQEVHTTLESAIEGLTGGEPVSLEAFEHRIRTKVN